MATRRAGALGHRLLPPRRPLPSPNPETSIDPRNPNPSSFLLRRGLAVWSSTKDPALESALSRNRRWIVNNQIKRLLLRHPAGAAPVRLLQKHFKTLDLQGRALNWLHKYPCCFETFSGPDGDRFFRLTKRMQSLVDEEAAAAAAAEPAISRRLAKLLMLARGRRLNVVKLNELRRSFGFPDDYVLGIVAKYPEMFRVTNRYNRRNSMEIELVNWVPELAVSAVEAAAADRGTAPMYTCLLPESWVKTREKFDQFNEGYVSPYSEDWSELEKVDPEKRAVGVVHELLSLTLWKKASIVKLGHFKREFGLPERLNVVLLRHPCIFYVSNRYKIYTVVLREGYRGAELAEEDPLVVVKDKLGELMQEGLHEYNRRRRLANLEKKRKRGEIEVRAKREEEEEDEASVLDSVEKREERKRFYKVLFDEIP